jgi:hypothetical protein
MCIVADVQWWAQGAVSLGAMEKRSVEAIAAGLEGRGVRYLIVGGLAVVAHGFVRFTSAVDLVLSVEKGNLAKAVAALTELEYRPRAPVVFEEFLDEGKRRKWAMEKGQVFSLYSPRHAATEVDLFLEPPLDFGKAYGRAARLEVVAGVSATFCHVDDLIELKARADRAVDREDIAQLRRIHKKEQP